MNYESALKIDKNFAPSLYNLGSANYNANNYFNAEYFYKRSLSINNKDIDSLTELGMLYLDECDYKNALKYSSMANDISKRFESYITLGHAYSLREMYTDAIIQYKIALSLNGSNAETYFSLGYCYEKLSDFKIAQEMYDKSTYYSTRIEFNKDRILTLIKRCSSKHHINSKENKNPVSIEIEDLSP